MTPEWTPFERAPLAPFDRRKSQALAREMGVPYASIKRAYLELAASETWLNSRYQVNVFRGIKPEGWPHEMIWLSIKRIDKAPIHDWRELQRVKNSLVGEEHEGFEMYPAESRLVDTANQYHLFVFADPGIRLPMGWQVRSVTNSAADAINPETGCRQRPIDNT